MAEERDLWGKIALAEHLIALAHHRGKTQDEGECWLGLGTCYFFLDLLEEAISAFERAISLLRSTQAISQMCSASCCLGNALLRAGRYLQAIPVLEEALQLAKAVADEDAKCDCLSHLGYALTEAGQPQKALSYQMEALSLVKQRGDREAEINELGKLGNVYADLYQIPEALTCYEQALSLAREEGDQEEEASQLGNLGAAYTDHLRQPEKGLQLLQEAYRIFQACGDRQNEAKTLVNIAGALTKADRGNQALEALNQAQGIAAALGNSTLLGWIASQRGKVYDQVGQTKQSMHAHEQALLLKRGHGDGREVIEDLSRLGMARLSQGQPKEALAYHKKALDLARKLGDRLKEAQQLDSIANALQELREGDESALYRTLALALFRELGDVLGEGRAYVNSATASIRIVPWSGIQGNKKKALAGWRMGHTLLSCIEPAEAETTQRKIETLKQAEGEVAFGRLIRASDAYLRWFSFQRYWLDGDLLRFILLDDELTSFGSTMQAWSAEVQSGTPLHQALLRAVSISDAGEQRKVRAAYQEALGLAREQDHRHVAALLLGSLGSLYGAAGMWEESTICSRQAQEYFHELEDRPNEMKAFLNLGTAQLRLLFPKEALESIRLGSATPARDPRGACAEHAPMLTSPLSACG
jgi:tetratricopeptide (TPR) repeat protein